jgi:UDP-4-amino-4,6-dideoxy-N-acetyl-beta-L-altrosamine transaminase
MPKFIPYGRHLVNDADIKAVEDVLRSDWLTCGSAVERFENILKDVVGAEFAISCSNGTTALHLALLALGVKPGDKVIVPAITFLASANAVRYVGADVVFADVDPETGLLTAETLLSAIQNEKNSASIKAVINVHLAGQCGDLNAIYNLAKQYNMFVVEDAAHAIGTSHVDSNGKVQAIGSNSFSDLTTFSFHPVKTIALGEGGAVTTNNPVFAEKLKSIRSHGMVRDSKQWMNAEDAFDKDGSPNPWYYEMHELGYNYRISDINCALGSSQLTRLEEFKSIRQRLVDQYDEAFSGQKYIKPLKKLATSDTAWHLYVLHIHFDQLGKSRTEVMEQLKAEGIGTQVHYIPVCNQLYYTNLYGKQFLTGAEQYYRSCLSLPLYVGLTDEEQIHVIDSVLKICSIK